ncbi:MAG: DNA repair protein RecO C-terminal domain-containing protein [Pyrinomonadaceae bacterium]
MVKACIETASNDPEFLLSTGVYFELWLLRLSGYLPDWSSCDGCGNKFDDVEETEIQTNLHLKYKSCRRATTGRVMEPSVRRIANAARRLSPDNFGQAAGDYHNELRTLSTLLKRLISQSIGREVSGEVSLAVNK